jgi:hypothetical protein
MLGGGWLMGWLASAAMASRSLASESIPWSPGRPYTAWHRIGRGAGGLSGVIWLILVAIRAPLGIYVWRRV